MMGIKKDRVIIVSGTDKASELYNVAGVIKMIASKKITYTQIGHNVHMFTYKANESKEKDLRELLRKNFPNFKFGYLNEKVEEEA